jgi:hypothetical protein
VTLLALLLVAVVPVALLAGVVMMMLGQVAGGLELFGGSVLAAAVAVALASMSGMRHLRKLVSESSFRLVRLDGSQDTDVAEPAVSDYTHVVQLDRSEDTEVRLPPPPPLLAAFWAGYLATCQTNARICHTQRARSRAVVTGSQAPSTGHVRRSRHFSGRSVAKTSIVLLSHAKSEGERSRRRRSSRSTARCQ